MSRPLPRVWLPASVRARVTVAAALGLLVVLVATSVFVVAAQRALLTEELEETLSGAAAANALVDVTAAAIDTETLASPTDDDGVAQLVDADGRVLASTANIEGEAPVASDPPPGDDQVRRTVDDVPVDDAPYMVVSRRVGDRVIHVGATLADIDESTRLLAGSLAIAVPVATALLVAFVWWLVGRTLRPVESIRAEVASIGGADLDRRVPEPPGDDEIARLARTMNSMLGRVESASERQRRFVADASHELRTPLTRMRAELEVDLAHPDEADPAATHRSALDEVIGLQRLVDDLLALARADAGVPLGARTDIDLGTLARRQAERVARPGLAVEVTGDGATVVGDVDALGRAVGNVVDNAARFAASAVTIDVAATDGRAVVVVADDGPGIPPADRARVFERFTRLDTSRATGTGGAGLGLSIARDIVERHGGAITVAGDALGGARVVIELPSEHDSSAS